MNTKAALGLGITVIAVLSAGLFLNYDPAENVEPEPQQVSTFESEEDLQELISASEHTGEASTGSYEQLDAAAEREYAEAAEMDQASDIEVEAPDSIIHDDNSIYISHRWPQHFQSVNVPELELDHNESEFGGQKIQTDETLVIQEEDRIAAYNKENLEEEWSKETENRVEEYRKLGDRLILLTRETDGECPARPVYGVEISCSNILRPVYGGQVDYSYQLTSLDIENGDEIDSIGFAASSRAEIKVTPETTYISYTDETPEADIMEEFLLQEAGTEIADRVEEIQGYDLSQRSREIEMERAINENLDEDEREDLGERFEAYDRENMREHTESTLLQIDNIEMNVTDTSTFVGSINDIQEKQGEVLLTSEIRGVDYSNRETDLIFLNGETKTFEDRARPELGLEKVYLEQEDKLKAFNHHDFGDETSFEQDFRTFELFGDKVFAVGQREDSSQMLYLLDSDLEMLDETQIEDSRIYSVNSDYEDSEQVLFNVYGVNQSRVVQLDLEYSEINVDTTEASGEFMKINEDFYTVSSGEVNRINENFNIEETLELELRRTARPMPEPVPR